MAAAAPVLPMGLAPGLAAGFLFGALRAEEWLGNSDHVCNVGAVKLPAVDGGDNGKSERFSDVADGSKSGCPSGVPGGDGKN